MSDPWADASDQTLRAAVRRAITDAYYGARNAGRTMEMAADDATEAVILVVEHGWTDSALASSQPTTPPCCDDKGGSFCRDTTGLSSCVSQPATLDVERLARAWRDRDIAVARRANVPEDIIEKWTLDKYRPDAAEIAQYDKADS